LVKEKKIEIDRREEGG